MNDAAKILILTGFVLILAGSVVMLLGKIPGMGRLPGDWVLKKGDFAFYFPVVSCLVVSLLITIVLNLWSRKP
ncbi:MAG: DUF2905 domain-containing protein [Candidatus Omnitrophota bacterium]